MLPWTETPSWAGTTPAGRLQTPESATPRSPCLWVIWMSAAPGQVLALSLFVSWSISISAFYVSISLPLMHFPVLHLCLFSHSYVHLSIQQAYIEHLPSGRHFPEAGVAAEYSKVPVLTRQQRSKQTYAAGHIFPRWSYYLLSFLFKRQSLCPLLLEAGQAFMMA